MEKLSTILESRGYVYQHSAGSLAEITDGESRVLYLGIDPTADSLHVGHLQMLCVLRHFHEAGHKVIILVGGGTGMIGDPSGKHEERNLLDVETTKANAEAMRKQIERVAGIADLSMVNNADWLGELTLIDFLRDIGKHFTVNSMVKKDMVRERLEAESPLSYTEFAYAILQGYDFLHLFEKEKCTLQIGASDQWGNITAGIELIRKKTGGTAYGITAPLLINKATGKKFGKSEGGAIWLDPQKTPPFAFYQFWLQSEDAAIEEYLTRMTFMSLEEIKGVMDEHAKDPSKRHGQHALAHAVTELVHGRDAAEEAARVSGVLFGETALDALSKEEQRVLIESAPSLEVSEGMFVVDVLVQSGLASSKRDARHLLEAGAIMLGAHKVSDIEMQLKAETFENKLLFLRKGKRDVCVLYMQ